ncbi:hypothetical protein KNP414_05388 [Paenibacillus mucilaginosus KNP414]|uniref:Uncharacterized protein n=1 Tax=Paenibacillus mucilaginosus (strain KNP414) TaxID=1036673 RepID=F8FG92_PAEMK|nr:hypothetical protein KNP414_05388 [Paenibacillus mucilaginosus KNP414]
MLQSFCCPDFLYSIPKQQGPGTDPANHDGERYPLVQEADLGAHLGQQVIRQSDS